MPQFRIYRMKDAPRQNFRWAPHVSGSIQVKQKDYVADEDVEALHEYAAWAHLKSSAKPLAVGDILETETGELKICKYVGWETAVWMTGDTTALSKPQPEQS